MLLQMLAQVDPPTPVTWDISSTIGIVALTMGTVQLLKQSVWGSGFFAKVPVFLYAIVVSGALTFAASKWIMIEGHPALQGDLTKNIMDTLKNAAIASGVFSWVTNPSSLGSSGDKPK